jgi:cytidylate kinase
MSKRVVAVSRTIGAGGETVGRMVSKQLGWRYVDDEIVSAAAKSAGVKADLVADAEKRRGILLQFVDGLGDPGPRIGGFMFTGADEGDRSEDFRTLIREAVKQTAERGEVVIVAHAASLALAGKEDVLRVLITASAEMRVWRVAEQAKVPLAKATEIVQHSDAARADYIKRFYDIATELPTHYDLIVNTDAVSPEETARAVTSLVSENAEG